MTFAYCGVLSVDGMVESARSLGRGSEISQAN